VDRGELQGHYKHGKDNASTEHIPIRQCCCQPVMNQLSACNTVVVSLESYCQHAVHVVSQLQACLQGTDPANGSLAHHPGSRVIFTLVVGCKWFHLLCRQPLLNLTTCITLHTCMSIGSNHAYKLVDAIQYTGWSKVRHSDW